MAKLTQKTLVNSGLWEMYMSHSWGFHLNQQRSLRAAHYPLVSTKINSIIPMFFPKYLPKHIYWLVVYLPL